MKKLILILLVLPVLSCTQPKKHTFNKEEVSEVLMKQKEAWNEGDISGYMEGYWKSDSLLFIGKNGVSSGWQKVNDNYLRSYPDKTAMGKLEFDLLHINPIENEHARVIGKWTLFRESDTLGGHYMLLLKKFDNGWKIVADATS